MQSEPLLIACELADCTALTRREQQWETLRGARMAALVQPEFLTSVELEMQQRKPRMPLHSHNNQSPQRDEELLFSNFFQFFRFLLPAEGSREIRA